jgi:hypothetical protein
MRLDANRSATGDIGILRWPTRIHRVNLGKSPLRLRCYRRLLSLRRRTRPRRANAVPKRPFASSGRPNRVRLRAIDRGADPRTPVAGSRTARRLAHAVFEPPRHRVGSRQTRHPHDKVVVTVEQHGDTSAASVPLALSVAIGDGRIKRGDLVMIEAMGGGFTWGEQRRSAVAGLALPAWLHKLIDRAFASSMGMILRAPTGIAYLGYDSLIGGISAAASRRAPTAASPSR